MPIEYVGPSSPIFTPAKVRAPVEAELKRQAGLGVSEFKKTTATWRTSVNFTVERQGNGEYSAGTDSDIFAIVNNGSPPHTIRARDGGRLAFQPSYTAKTTPRQIGSQSGGSSGGFVYAREVRHPGTAARNFDEAIAEKLQPDAEAALQRVITRASTT